MPAIRDYHTLMSRLACAFMVYFMEGATSAEFHEYRKPPPYAFPTPFAGHLLLSVTTPFSNLYRGS